MTPSTETISIDSTIIFEMNLPKTYFDINKNKSVSFVNTFIEGNIGIACAEDSMMRGLESIVDLTFIKGSNRIDTINYSSNQMLYLRIYKAIEINDSTLQLKFKIKPKQKGVYSIGFTSFAGHSSNCSTHIYRSRPSAPNQHLYLLYPYGGTYLGYNAETYWYCFKVI
jgi:hypothetical protein